MIQVSPDSSPPFAEPNTCNLSATQVCCIASFRHIIKSVFFVQKSHTKTSRRRCSSSGEHSRESYVKLQFVDLAGSECIGKMK